MTSAPCNPETLQQTSTMSVQALSAEQARVIQAQIFCNSNFRTANSHLTPAELTALLTRTVWPDKPVFSPYARTHHGYSQGKFLHFAFIFKPAIDRLLIDSSAVSRHEVPGPPRHVPSPARRPQSRLRRVSFALFGQKHVGEHQPPALTPGAEHSQPDKEAMRPRLW
jgi:hypothetical protein